MKSKDLQNLLESTVFDEVKKLIIKESKEDKHEVYHVTCEGEPVGTCESEDKAHEIVNKLEKEHPGKQFIIEKKSYSSYGDMIDKLDEMGEELEENENMKTIDTHEGNAFSAALNKAKEAGEEKFTVDGKEYDVEECWSQMKEEEEECDECNSMEEELTGDQYKLDANDNDEIDSEDFKLLRKKKVNENKKVVRLTESELIKLIGKMVNEASVPGLETLKTTRTGSGKESNEHLADVEKKMKDYLTFDNNDNPEFPKQISKGEKVADNNTDEENEFVDSFRGGTLLDLDYDSEPSAQFKDRMKKALEGDATMGNSQEYANVIKTETGKKLAKVAVKKEKEEEKMPMYIKDPAPIKNVNESKNESSILIENEIKRMKMMSEYNKKTQ